MLIIKWLISISIEKKNPKQTTDKKITFKKCKRPFKKAVNKSFWIKSIINVNLLNYADSLFKILNIYNKCY